MEKFKLLINGDLVEASSKEYIDVLNPYNNEVVGSVPKGTKEDAMACLKAAKDAQKAWALLPAQKRAEYVSELADIMEENVEMLAKLLTSEHGKPLHEAMGEVQGAVGFLRYAVESARRIEGDIITSEKQDEQIWIQKVPFGVVVGIVAWNFPLALAARKIGNALVCGNTMIMKPPSETPLTVMKYAELVAAKSSLPKGVLNFITGSGRVVGDALVRNDITQMVTLTGSTQAGIEVFKAAAENVVVVHLELGGKAPYIVMDDADVDKAAKCAAIARFSNCGQICTCNERMYIHEKVYEEFKTKFLSHVKEIKVGDPMNADTNMGPKVNMPEVEKLNEMKAQAVKEGAKVLLDMTPDKLPTEKGNWFYPAVLEVTDNKNVLMQQETFGPIAPMMKVKSFDEAIELANDCEYGLSAYLFTNNAKLIMRAVNELDFGEVYVNRENGELLNGFHNGYKKSGLGGEDGKYGLDGYLQKKTIYMNYNY